MKNLINYYYGMQINEYKKRDSSFYFFYNKKEFEFVEFFGDINNVINLFSYLKYLNRNVDEIIINNKNSFITYYEDKSYILLKKYNSNRIDIELEDILEYDVNIYRKGKINWKNLWKEKIDYYEIQLTENKLNYPIIEDSFSYYIGMSELAISLLNYIDLNSVDLYISHKRIDSGSNFFNPTNLIFDSKSRDIAEYIKKIFFEEKNYNFDLTKLIDNIFFTTNEAFLFLSRLIYPSYYFDMYEKIYEKKFLEENIKKIIKKNTDYEAFLKKIYMILKQKYDIPQIEFFQN